MGNIKILYLLGAGRSGTTLLAIVLDSISNIKTQGELHQFYSHVKNTTPCSCSKELDKCDWWSIVLKDMGLTQDMIDLFQANQAKKERHNQIPKLFIDKNIEAVYKESQELLFSSISSNQKEEWLLDSSKYISRFLLLSRIKLFRIKGVYVVRDVRGVINSFGKQVQTPKNPIKSIIYYLLINTWGQIVCWLNKDVLKVKYEDFVDSPHKEINRILLHISDDNIVESNINTEFKMPHIIGGNRMKSNKTIAITSDFEWKRKIKRKNQILYYVICFPFMVLNKYRI